MPEFHTPGHLSPTATLFVIASVLMSLAGAFGWAVYGWGEQRRRAAAALASLTSGPPPARGAVVLHGVVETEVPHRPAITVTLLEIGEEKQEKNGWSHKWTEQKRETKAEPFYLVLSGSARALVRVEPDDDVLLVDRLDVLEPGNPRSRRAELTNGETAYVSGVIGRGWHARASARRGADGLAAEMPSAHGSAYRGGPTDGLVLRPGRDRMLVSTEPLDQRYVRLAKAHRLFTFVLGLALAFASTVVFGPAVLTEAFGKTVDAEVLLVRHWTTNGKHGPNHHYAATARYTAATGRSVLLTEDVNEDVYLSWQGQNLPRMPFVVAFDTPLYANVGTRTTTDVARGVLSVIGTFALLFLYVRALGIAREWYDKRRVVTRGSGPL